MAQEGDCTHAVCASVVMQGGRSWEESPMEANGLSFSRLPLHTVHSSIFNPDCVVSYLSIDSLAVGDSEEGRN